ncbi:MAG: CDP-alcohol phosphatidyltransferase family protein [Reyranellaceae bacterium]
MKLWIDAAAAGARPRVFGMGLVERHIRGARHRNAEPLPAIVSGGDDPSLPPALAGDAVVLSHEQGPLGARLAAALRAGGEALLVAAGDTAVDQRLYGELRRRRGNWMATDEDGGVALLRLEPDAPLAAIEAAADWPALIAALGAQQGVSRLRQQDFAAHIAALRRDLPFWLRRVETEAQRAALERFMFEASYKGSTDFFTKYVYPPLVWAAVRPLARWRVHPNTVTLVSIVLTFAAVPFFALGWWLAGLLCAYGMSVLDSVDGKLARLTYSDSALGNLLDHGLDIVHPPLWYLGWALGLAGLGLAPYLDQALAEPAFQAALALIGFYVLDRLVLAVYKARFGRGLHAHAPVDRLARTVISRRNINLPLFTLGLVFGLGLETFYFIVLWQIATVFWHAGRTAWILLRGEKPLPA